MTASDFGGKQAGRQRRFCVSPARISASLPAMDASNPSLVSSTWHPRLEAAVHWWPARCPMRSHRPASRRARPQYQPIPDGLFIPYRADLLPLRGVLSVDRSGYSWRSGAVLTILPWRALASNDRMGAGIGCRSRASRCGALSVHRCSGHLGIRNDPAKAYDLAFFADQFFLHCISPKGAAASRPDGKPIGILFRCAQRIQKPL